MIFSQSQKDETHNLWARPPSFLKCNKKAAKIAFFANQKWAPDPRISSLSLTCSHHRSSRLFLPPGIKALLLSSCAFFKKKLLWADACACSLAKQNKGSLAWGSAAAINSQNSWRSEKVSCWLESQKRLHPHIFCPCSAPVWVEELLQNKRMLHGQHSQGEDLQWMVVNHHRQ